MHCSSFAGVPEADRLCNLDNRTRSLATRCCGFWVGSGRCVVFAGQSRSTRLLIAGRRGHAPSVQAKWRLSKLSLPGKRQQGMQPAVPTGITRMPMEPT